TLLLNHIGARTKDRSDRSVFVARTGRVIRKEELQRLIDREAILTEGDTVKDGKIIDSNGEETPVVTEEQHEKAIEAAKKGEVKSQADIRRMIEEDTRSEERRVWRG